MQPAASLSPAQRRRYARQLSLREIGEAGQRALCAARPELPAGADPEAAHIALDYLTRAGLTTDAQARAVSIDVPAPSSIAALAGQASLRVAASALAGAFAAVEAIKALTGTGQPATLAAELRLSPEPGWEPQMRSGKIGSIIEAVGNTPLLRLRQVTKDLKDVKVYLKLEYCNPGGSVKDRPALQMMRDAIADGRLTKDKILIDATSGNTGVAYSLFGAALGYRVHLVMPENVSQARKDITQAFGTELIFSDPMEGSDGAIRVCRELVAKEPDRYFYADQYRNPSNPKAHYLGTGREILEQVGHEITHFVAGLGTSGTAMGTTRRLHEHTRKVICVAAQPDEALHGLEGLKHMDSSLVPEIYDKHVPDEHMTVPTDDGWDMADRLAEEEGLHVGHSTGANVHAAIEIAKRIGHGCVVTVACDRGDRYFAPLRWEKRYEW